MIINSIVQIHFNCGRYEHVLAKFILYDSLLKLNHALEIKRKTPKLHKLINLANVTKQNRISDMKFD